MSHYSNPVKVRAFGLVASNCTKCHFRWNGNYGGQCIQVDTNILSYHYVDESATSGLVVHIIQA